MNEKKSQNVSYNNLLPSVFTRFYNDEISYEELLTNKLAKKILYGDGRTDEEAKSKALAEREQYKTSQKNNIVFALATYRILSEESSQNKPLSYKEILDHHIMKSLSLTTVYQLNTIQKYFRELFNDFELAGIYVKKVGNKFYLENSLDSCVNYKADEEFKFTIMDILNRSSQFYNEYNDYNFGASIWDGLIALLGHESYDEYHVDTARYLEKPIRNYYKDLICYIKYAVDEEKNLTITFHDNSSLDISIYDLLVHDSIYYIIGTPAKSKDKKLCFYNINSIYKVDLSKSKFVQFNEIIELSTSLNDCNNDKPKYDIQKRKEINSICSKFLVENIDGSLINIRFKFNQNKLSRENILNDLSSSSIINNNEVTLKNFSENKFIKWSICNYQYIKIEDNTEICDKIVAKRNEIFKTTPNVDTSTVDLYITIDNESYKDEIGKYGIIDIGLENKTIIKCYTSNLFKFFQYVMYNPDKVSLTNYNNYSKVSENTKNAYITFLKTLNKNHIIMSSINTSYNKYDNEILHMNKNK